jgi:phosphate transport system substrate-binding protein
MGAVALALGLGVGAAGCDDAGPQGVGQSTEPVRLRGVGATVPRALFAKWSQEYARVDPRVTLEYEAAGSGAGVRAAKEKTADVGISDSPLSDADASSYPGVRHLPLAVEAIAIVYSFGGATGGTSARLQVSEDVLADMLMGRITWWDDPQIAALNAGARLPHTAIRVVFRADESGSSYLVSEWLSKTTRRWPLSATRALALPVGVAAVKDEGVVARMHQTDGTLSYLSAVTALSERLPSLALRNAAGRFVTPSLEGMRAAAATAQLGSDLRAHATGASGDLAYPLCSFTFALVPVDGADGSRRRALARFLWWATHDGQKFAPPLGFGALPGELAVRDEAVMYSLKAAGEAAL